MAMFVHKDYYSLFVYYFDGGKHTETLEYFPVFSFGFLFS